MSLVHRATGEVLVPLDESEARALTDRIKRAAEETWALLLEAHERKAWASLGYANWREYATAEFGMSQSQAYRLLDHARVVTAIEEVTGSPMGEISEREARDLKPHLAEVADAVRERTNGLPRERVAEIVQEVVLEERQRIVRQREDDAAIAELNALAPPGFDPVADKATWPELLAGEHEREEHVTAAQAKLEQYRSSMDVVRPQMESNPVCTVADAIRGMDGLS